MFTTATATERALDPNNLLRYQRVRLHANARTVTTTDVRTGDSNWHNAFMSALGTTNFNGEVDWVYGYDNDKVCLALHSLSHADVAVQVLTTLVLECNMVIGWFDMYEVAYGETMAATLLRNCILVDREFRVDYTSDSKTGWTLAFTNIDTSAIVGVRHQLPVHVAQWLNPEALEGQAV
jgi:hypothetical protein